jgi:hypothetical protein
VPLQNQRKRRKYVVGTIDRTGFLCHITGMSWMTGAPLRSVPQGLMGASFRSGAPFSAQVRPEAFLPGQLYARLCGSCIRDSLPALTGAFRVSAEFWADAGGCRRPAKDQNKRWPRRLHRFALRHRGESAAATSSLSSRREDTPYWRLVESISLSRSTRPKAPSCPFTYRHSKDQPEVGQPSCGSRLIRGECT